MKIRHAAILLALLSADALAQQNSAAPALSLPPGRPADNQPQRQGPELDVFHPEVATPPVDEPVVAPTIAPQAAPAVRPAINATTPAPARPARQPVREAATPAKQPEPTAPAAGKESEASPVVADTPPAEPPAPPVAEAQSAPSPETAATPATQDQSLWLWIIGGLVLIGGLSLLVWRQRKHEQSRAISAEAAPPVSPTPPVAPASVAPPVAPPPPVALAAPRAQLTLSLDIVTARLGLAGLTVGFRLILTNEGEEAAQDAGIRALMASADAGPTEALQQFYGGAIGHPFANGLTIEPGASLAVGGEITLPPESTRPIEVGTRRLLIPMIAFDAHYRWREEGAPGVGRTGGAFIVGQEQEPPVQRLAPFRLDLGPRQYRRPGARATGFAPEA